MNLTPDFIKWMCGKCDNWEYGSSFVQSPDLQLIIKEEMDSKEWTDIYLPLLVQQTIDAINFDKENNYFICQSEGSISIEKENEGLCWQYCFGGRCTVQNAKIAALQWVKDHESA